MRYPLFISLQAEWVPCCFCCLGFGGEHTCCFISIKFLGERSAPWPCRLIGCLQAKTARRPNSQHNPTEKAVTPANKLNLIPFHQPGLLSALLESYFYVRPTLGWWGRRASGTDKISCVFPDWPGGIEGGWDDDEVGLTVLHVSQAADHYNGSLSNSGRFL